jgi:hypothetical protein
VSDDEAGEAGIRRKPNFSECNSGPGDGGGSDD